MGHTARVGALAWNGDVLSSGSRDRMILQRDTRTPRKLSYLLIFVLFYQLIWVLQLTYQNDALLDTDKKCAA